MISTSVKLSSSNTTSDSIAFGVTDGSYGYIIPGADTVTPFKNTINIVYLGGAGSYDCSSYNGYKNFTNDNFYCKSVNASFSLVINDTSNSRHASGSVTGYNVSYNSNTGIVVCSDSSVSGNSDGTRMSWSIAISLSYYLIY